MAAFAQGCDSFGVGVIWFMGMGMQIGKIT